MLRNPEIRFEVTNRCNANCIMCPREKMTRAQGILDMGLYRRVLDEAVSLGAKHVGLENYGESLLDPYLFERAEYARSKGMTVFTVTNAALLDRDRRERVVELFNKVRISMYGMTESTYEKIHRGLDFSEVRRNVELLFRERDSRKSPLRIEMYFLLMDENKGEMESFIERYAKLADAVSVWKPHNWGNGRNYRNMRPGPKVSCGRPHSGPVQVQWDGLVVPCCFDYDSKIVLGDLNRNTLHEILDGEAYDNLRKAHSDGDFSGYPFCDACDQLQKRRDVLVYTTIKDSRVGATNSNYFSLDDAKKKKAPHGQNAAI